MYRRRRPRRAAAPAVYVACSAPVCYIQTRQRLAPRQRQSRPEMHAVRHDDNQAQASLCLAQASHAPIAPWRLVKDEQGAKHQRRPAHLRHKGVYTRLWRGDIPTAGRMIYSLRADDIQCFALIFLLSNRAMVSTQAKTEPPKPRPREFGGEIRVLPTESCTKVQRGRKTRIVNGILIKRRKTQFSNLSVPCLLHRKRRGI